MVDCNILANVKNNIGIPEDVTDFDMDIILYINLALDTIIQLGLNIKTNINSDSEWRYVLSDISEDKYSLIQTYVMISVRLIFDPPANSTIVNSLKDKIKELEFRLQIKE